MDPMNLAELVGWGIGTGIVLRLIVEGFASTWNLLYSMFWSA